MSFGVSADMGYVHQQIYLAVTPLIKRIAALEVKNGVPSSPAPPPAYRSNHIPTTGGYTNQEIRLAFTPLFARIATLEARPGTGLPAAISSDGPGSHLEVSPDYVNQQIRIAIAALNARITALESERVPSMAAVYGSAPSAPPARLWGSVQKIPQRSYSPALPVLPNAVPAAPPALPNAGPSAESLERGRQLHAAIEAKNVEESLRLIEAGAALTVENEDGDTALLHACREALVPVALIILSKPCVDVDARNHYNETALMFASENGSLELVSALLDRLVQN